MEKSEEKKDRTIISELVIPPTSNQITNNVQPITQLMSITTEYTLLRYAHLTKSQLANFNQ